VHALHLLEIVLSASKPQPAPAAPAAAPELPAVPEGEEEGAPSPSAAPADTNMDGEPFVLSASRNSTAEESSTQKPPQKA